MTTPTVLARESRLLGDAEYLDRWRTYVDGDGLNDDEKAAVVTALMNVQREEFNKRLPAGCTWLPSLSEVHGPAGTQLPDLTDLMFHAMAGVLECYLESRPQPSPAWTTPDRVAARIRGRRSLPPAGTHLAGRRQ